MRYYLKYILTFLVISFSLGCSQDGLHILETKEITSWRANEAVSFDQITAEDAKNLVLVIDHDENYQYENLYIKVISRANNEILSEDIASIELLDANGFWQGKKSRMGRRLPYSLNPDIKGENASSISLDIFQYSRDDILNGINAISVARSTK